MAEAVFRHTAKENNLLDKFSTIDSAGTAGYHHGDDPDYRTLDVCNANNVDILHSARRVEKEDFYKFDYIFAMDRSNLNDLERMKRKYPDAERSRVMMFGDFAGEGRRKGEVVEDPWYGGMRDFEKVFAQTKRFSENFLREVLGAEID
ncbi:hypothetical protein ABW19_dt0210642 [Dactylella cylindrospora]|nr:hypothetical protein ABW19_dt0210642 [Dactylella cylindrospora]